MSTPEGKIKDRCKRFLKLHSISNWSIIPSAFGGSTGMADVCCITRDGRWLALERKAEGKKSNVTANQQKFLDTINEHGGRAYVISCDADIAELEKTLKFHELI